jgi:hypothetical protein
VPVFTKLPGDKVMLVVAAEVVVVVADWAVTPAGNAPRSQVINAFEEVSIKILFGVLPEQMVGGVVTVAAVSGNTLTVLVHDVPSQKDAPFQYIQV